LVERLGAVIDRLTPLPSKVQSA